jgi:hypothetical protein
MSQTLCQAVDVKKKTATNISLPGPILSRFDAMAATLIGGQTKWIVASAAMLALLQMDAKSRRALFSRVTGADSYEGGIEELIADMAVDDPAAPESPPANEAAAPPRMKGRRQFGHIDDVSSKKK